MQLKFWDKNKEYFDELPIDDYNALKADIAENGIINALHILNDGTVICGNQRLKICRELKIPDNKIPVKHLKFKDKREIILYAIKENLLRRHLTMQQKAKPVSVYIQLKEDMQKERIEKIKRDNKGRITTWDTMSTLDRSRDIIAKDVGVGSGRTLDRLIRYNKAIEEMPELKEKHESMAGVMREYRKIKFLETKKNEKKLDIQNCTLYQGDAVAELKKIKDKSVDVVVIDPPYGIDYIEMTNSGNDADGRAVMKSHNKNFEDGKEYALQLLDNVCKEFKRICKDDAHLYIFFGMTNYPETRDILKKYFIIDVIPLIWVKSNFPLGRDVDKQYQLIYECIFFCKNNNTDRLLTSKCSENILYCDVVQGKMHPTQKPIGLIEYLIKNSSVEGDVILDCFMGSGTAAIAALNNKRKFIGIEKDEEFFKISEKRIEKEVVNNER